MKFLVSVVNEKEARMAVKGGADIIDVKNPAEGSLGANFPWIVRNVRKAVPKKIEVSATIGDFPNLPGTAALASLGAASCGVDYVKVGLFGTKNEKEAVALASAVVRAVKTYNFNNHKKTKIVIAGYADFKKIGSVNPFLLPKIASKVGADFVMIDTAIKNGSNLFGFFSLPELKKFVDQAHKKNLGAAFGGSLKKEDVKKLFLTGVDVAGFRTAVCAGGNRLDEISMKRVSELKQQFLSSETI